MKKVLLTTSALTLLAGAAAAVDIGGYARIGISNADGATTNYLRNQITFTGSAATDGGLTMSTWTRYRHSAASSVFAGTGAFAAPRISVSNGAMTLTAGNAGGAINANSGMWGCGTVMWGCADVVGSWDWASTSSTGTGPNVVRLDMALGGASVSVSGGNGNDTEASLSMPMGGGSVGVGFDQNSATNQTISVNYSGTMSGMGVGLRMSQSDGSTGYIGNVTAPMGAGSVYIFAGKTLAGDNNYGLRYNQSLGGGASMHAGVTSAAGATTVGAGVAFGF
jgi:outer membrane protein OmpU